LGHFPIGCRCCISSIELGIYLAKTWMAFGDLEFHLQRLIMVWGAFPSFLDVGYHLLNLVSIFHNLNDF
jgi:hypothetical protein